MKNHYTPSYYSRYYVAPLFTRLHIADFYYLWIAYFCLIRPAKLKQGDRVLDFGCGVGAWVWALRKFGIEAYGVDSGIGAKKYSRMPQFCTYGNTDKLNFPNNYFSLIFSNEVLEHIPEKKLPAVLNELLRVSRGLMIHMVGVADKGSMVTEEPSHEIIEDERWWSAFFGKLGYTISRGSRFYFFPHVHLALTGKVSWEGLKSGYFILRK